MLLLTFFTCLLFSLLVWFWLKWTKVRRYWADKNVPHFPPHPIWGSLTFLQKRNIVYFLEDIYNTYKNKSPYAGMWLFWKPLLIINCPEIAKRVMVKDAHVFRDRSICSGKNDPIGCLNLFAVKDPLWSSIRRRLTPVFTAAKLRSIHGLITGKSKELIQRVHMEIEKKGKPIDLRVLYADFTTDIIGAAAFGIHGEATLTGDSPIRAATRSIMEFNWYRGIELSSIFYVPQIVDICGFNFFPRAASSCMKKIFTTVVEKRGGYGEVREPRDLLDALVKIKQEAEKENDTEITEDVLVAQAVVFLQGGFDSNAVTMTYCTYELAFDEVAQERLYREVYEAKKALGDKEFDANTLAELHYLNGAVYEVLRKYAPMGWLDRIASEDYKVDDNLTIKAGTPIYVNAIGMHWDPDLFPEPKKFMPERFLPENEKNIKPFTFMPFGEGPRYCIGKRFAMQTIRYGLSSLILNFKFKPWPNTPAPNDVKIENKGLLLLPGEDLVVQFVPRHS